MEGTKLFVGPKVIPKFSLRSSEKQKSMGRVSNDGFAEFKVDKKETQVSIMEFQWASCISINL